jgi:hypothetical protein
MQVFRFRHLRTDEVLPRRPNWYEKRLEQGDCGSSSIIVTRDLWMAARSGFGLRYEGDFDYIVTAYNAVSKVTWTDRVIADVTINQGTA